MKSRCVLPGECGRLRLRADLVHGVAELVEEDSDFAVTQQRRRRRGRLRKVGDQGADGRLQRNKIKKTLFVR